MKGDGRVRSLARVYGTSLPSLYCHSGLAYWTVDRVVLLYLCVCLVKRGDLLKHEAVALVEGVMAAFLGGCPALSTPTCFGA